MASPHDLTILYALSAEVQLGPRAIASLLLHFSDPQSVWEADIDEIVGVGQLNTDAANRLSDARRKYDEINAELDHIIDEGTRVVSILDDAYPPRLRRLADPPTVLYYRGELPDPEQPAIAVVGTHKADAEGIADAVAWGKGLVQRGAAVISGLARGIDGGGHTGALAADGLTYAVLGSGFNNIYPPEHRGLATKIAEHGAIISEHPPKTPLTKQRLVLRNRIIVGLSDAVVVVRVHEDTRGSMEAIRRARNIAIPTFLVATDTSPMSQKAVADGAIPIPQVPDFDLVLNYL
ncbi:MAG: hypothetical protein Kow0074_25700 [Candidatus Zixiibacteriota bacterium]